MRMYVVSLNGQNSISINFRGSMFLLKEGDVYEGDSPIYKFYPRYFVPKAYYKPPVIEKVEEKVVEPKSTETKKTSIDDFSESINTNENETNDVIIETTNQEI